MLLSIVVPVYSCKSTLEALVSRLRNTLTSISPSFEIILVEDGCPSCSWHEIVSLAEKYSCIKGLKLSRNFGQHEAITAGLVHASGEWVVVMDCDLQDRPEEIVRLYEKAQEGFDIVYARRRDRQDSFLKKLSSRIFYFVLGYLTDTKIDASVANFGIYHRRVIQAVLQMKESLRYFPVMVRWVGFHSTHIDVEHNERFSGDTSYSLIKLLRLSLGVMVSFSDKPLHIIVTTGCLVSLVSALSALVIFIKALINGFPVEGWASLMISIWFIGGVVMAMVGVVGVYVGKSFDEAKKRPTYIVDTKTNMNN